MTEAVFPAVEPASPVYPGLQALRALIAADPGLHAGPADSVRAELRSRSRSGGVQLDRFYWSVRRTSPDAPLGFTARTLYQHRKVGAARVYDFPDEPVMDWLARPNGPLYSHGERARVEILRYIPLRRVTFLLHDGAGLPARVIAKTKRTTSLVRSTRVLVAVQRAARRRGVVGFAMPRPVGLDRRRQLLYLDVLPGRALSELLDELDVVDAMRRLGAIQRELHELDLPRVPTRRSGDWLQAAEVAATQVAVLVPSVAPRVEELHRELIRTEPGDAELGFCQGDFVPSQILCDPSGWSVLDLDDGHSADPCAEVTALYTALPRELSLPAGPRADLVRGAYLEGYVERAGRAFAPDRWRWFATVAELRYLARRLVKGRAQPGEAEAVLSAAGGAVPQALG